FLDTTLDVANGIEILAQLCPVTRSQAALQPAGALADRIQNTPLLAHASEPGGRIGRVAGTEQPLKHGPRVVLHRHRRRRPPPRDRVCVRSTVSGITLAELLDTLV